MKSLYIVLLYEYIIIYIVNPNRGIFVSRDITIIGNGPVTIIYMY